MRRVAHTTRLGWQHNRMVYVPLHMLRPDGGPSPLVVVVVQRVYNPFIWVGGHSGRRATTMSKRAFESMECEREGLLAKVQCYICSCDCVARACRLVTELNNGFNQCSINKHIRSMFAAQAVMHLPAIPFLSNGHELMQPAIPAYSPLCIA